MTELCDIAYKYGTDKCPQLKHSYTPFYYSLLKDRQQTIKKVLEMGIGCYEDMQNVDVIFDKVLNRNYHRGASLYMWRDFFPNAQIYGADYAPEAMFKDDRIETILCDERKKKDLVRLIEKTGSDIDLFVDDGSHKVECQIFLCQTIMPMLDKGVIYIIEDAEFPAQILEALSDYDCEVPRIRRRWHKSRLIVVKHK